MEQLSECEVKASIEEEPHRIGWPKLLPLPTTFKTSLFAPSLKMDYKERCNISGAIEKIRSKLGFIAYNVGEQRTLNNDNIEPVMMLTITAFTSVKGSNHWRDVIALLVQELQLDHNDPRLHIEVVECQFPQMQLLEAGHPAIGVWESSLKPAILRILKQSRIGLSRFLGV
ncbi:hypothetical protein BKA80DRAFT_309381 [Phyllosticta citrichinensis]